MRVYTLSLRAQHAALLPSVRRITPLFNFFLRSAHPRLHRGASLREQRIVFHITILRSRPAMEGEGQKGTKWAGEYKKGRTEREQRKGEGAEKGDGKRETNGTNT